MRCGPCERDEANKLRDMQSKVEEEMSTLPGRARARFLYGEILGRLDLGDLFS